MEIHLNKGGQSKKILNIYAKCQKQHRYIGINNDIKFCE